MTGARELRDAWEDAQFMVRVLGLWAQDVRGGHAPPLLEAHWWERLADLPQVLSRGLSRLERLCGRRKRRRARVSRWRERCLQYELPLTWAGR